jgi:hypothetical protein
MAFIGTPLDTRNTFQSLQGKRFDGDGSTTAFTLDVAPSSTLDIEVFVGNVRQDPNSAYTLSGTTLTFTGAPPSGTNNIYVVHQAKSVGTIGIPDDTISARTLVTLDNDNDHVLIEDATDGELKKALIPAATSVADAFTINGSTPTLTIGDAGAEDTKIVFDGNAQDFHVGLDDSADDLVIGLGSTLGTTTHMAFDETGAITKPLQPSFLCLKNGTASDVTGDGTVYTIAGWTETIDRNADFNNTSGVFTAPVTGLYLLTLTVYVQGFTTSHADNQVYFYSSNRNYNLLGVTMQSAVGHTGDYVVTGSQIVDMDASDTVSVRMDYRGDNKTIDVHDSTKFAGMLLA